jgi:hypothetical protein
VRKAVEFYRIRDQASVAVVVIDLKASKREIMAGFVAGLKKIRPKPATKPPSHARRQPAKGA